MYKVSCSECVMINVICFCRGTEDYLNCKGRVDIINSTLGKALGGAAGRHTGPVTFGN